MQHKGIPIEGATMSRSFMDPSYGEHVGTRISFLHFFFFFFCLLLGWMPNGKCYRLSLRLAQA